MSSRWIEIPMFDLRESVVVAELLEGRGVPFRRSVVHLGADMAGGRHAYTFWVPEDRFGEAIELLKEHYGLHAETGTASGDCPACGAAVVESERCPECGLNLSGDLSGVTRGHPFLLFLRDHGLL